MRWLERDSFFPTDKSELLADAAALNIKRRVIIIFIQRGFFAETCPDLHSACINDHET